MSQLRDRIVLMKTSNEVGSAKLRGGFYSPDELVQVALDRAMFKLGPVCDLRVLEPSAGDGAFIRGMRKHSLGEKVGRFHAVETLASESTKCASALEISGFNGAVVEGSALLDPDLTADRFDLAVGNPPFVRFQFIDDLTKASIASVGDELGIEFGGVSNLWIPVFLKALASLRDGGVFSFIVPSECFTGVSGRTVRDWLVAHTAGMTVDLFGPKSFPHVLQEVVVLSGRIEHGSDSGSKMTVFDHVSNEEWTHRIEQSSSTWMRYLLRPEHLSALDFALELSSVRRLDEVAKFGVSTVTGANGFFCIDDATRTSNHLEPWTRPMVSRIRHAPGLVLTAEDIAVNRAESRAVWMLDTSLALIDGPLSEGLLSYVRAGEAEGLDARYKCRVRSPWHSVPVVQPRPLLLSKRSNTMPRLVLNAACVVTTDTIYQGSLVGAASGEDVASSFHNSLTLLTAELHGRSFGGGVFELVPSEIAALAIPIAHGDSQFVQSLDALSRANDELALVHATNLKIRSQIPELDAHLMALLDDARQLLTVRRLARSA